MPQTSELSATTRSPTSKPLTLLPSAATTPTVSCPEQIISRTSLKRCEDSQPTGNERELGHEQVSTKKIHLETMRRAWGSVVVDGTRRSTKGTGVATKGVGQQAYKNSRGTHLGDELSLMDMQVLSARGSSTLDRPIRGDASEPTVPQTPQALTLI